MPALRKYPCFKISFVLMAKTGTVVYEISCLAFFSPETCLSVVTIKLNSSFQV